MPKERTKHSKGYWLLYRPNHPYANKDGYVPEQRLLMEGCIGRYVNPLVEDVHHRDGSVDNNVLENLILLTKSEHRRLHAGWKLINGEWWKICTGCGRLLKVEDEFYKRHTGHNEYTTRCKQCSKKQTHEKQQYYKKAKERTITCPVCGLVKKVPRYAKTKYCSMKCAWVARKEGE